jgi:hypothetical protein
MRTRPIVLLNDQKVKENLDEVRAVLRYLMQNPQHMGIGVPGISYGWYTFLKEATFDLCRYSSIPLPVSQIFGEAETIKCCWQSHKLFLHSRHSKLLQFVEPRISGTGITWRIRQPVKYYHTVPIRHFIYNHFTIMKARIQNSLLKYSSERIVAGATSAEAWAQLQSKRNENVVFHRIVGKINAEEVMKRIRRFALQTTIKVTFNK